MSDLAPLLHFVRAKRCLLRNDGSLAFYTEEVGSATERGLSLDVETEGRLRVQPKGEVLRVDGPGFKRALAALLPRTHLHARARLHVPIPHMSPNASEGMVFGPGGFPIGRVPLARAGVSKDGKRVYYDAEAEVGDPGVVVHVGPRGGVIPDTDVVDEAGLARVRRLKAKRMAMPLPAPSSA